MENVFYCADSCSPGCESEDFATRGTNEGYAQCQNIASRMVQKEALAHAQVCVCVLSVCVCCVRVFRPISGFCSIFLFPHLWLRVPSPLRCAAT